MLAQKSGKCSLFIFLISSTISLNQAHDIFYFFDSVYMYLSYDYVNLLQNCLLITFSIHTFAFCCRLSSFYSSFRRNISILRSTLDSKYSSKLITSPRLHPFKASSVIFLIDWSHASEGRPSVNTRSSGEVLFASNNAIFGTGLKIELMRSTTLDGIPLYSDRLIRREQNLKILNQ